MVLVGLSSLMLITYAYIALSEFERDKIAYVFDSTKSQTLSVANQVRTDLEYIIEKVQFFLCEDIRLRTKSFTHILKMCFF